MSWNESEPKRVDMGEARVYLTSDANYQWDSVRLEITLDGRAIEFGGDAQEASRLAEAIQNAAEAATAKRAEMMRPND